MRCADALPASTLLPLTSSCSYHLSFTPLGPLFLLSCKSDEGSPPHFLPCPVSCSMSEFTGERTWSGQLTVCLPHVRCTRRGLLDSLNGGTEAAPQQGRQGRKFEADT